jgi:exopolysaccharide biosynthesis predicted pyruvyltransferase EpsI
MNSSVHNESVIYIHGGGGYNPWWSGKQMIEFIKAYRTHDGILIQGPATVHADRAFLRERVGDPLEAGGPQSVHFYTRERTSYSELKEVLPERVHLRTDHDTALHLGTEDLPGAEGDSGEHTFYAIRNDKESEEVITRPKPFRMWYDPVLVCQSFKEWIRHHAQAAEVVTNRLHSAVLSSILDKPVTLLPNSYHKNRSVYEFSLSERGVEWEEKIESTTLDRLLSAFPARLQRSNRLAQGINNLRSILGRAVSLNRK